MSGRDWKPGDVALRVGRFDVERTMAVASCEVKDHPADLHWHHVSGGFDQLHSQIGTEYRPLVVIDPEDREQMRQVAECAADGDAAEWRIDQWQRFFRDLADHKPPKPQEPTGLGAVVEDERGEKWVRVDESRVPWRSPRADFDNYADIDAVEVLSQGVTA